MGVEFAERRAFYSSVSGAISSARSEFSQEGVRRRPTLGDASVASRRRHCRGHRALGLGLGVNYTVAEPGFTLTCGLYGHNMRSAQCKLKYRFPVDVMARL